VFVSSEAQLQKVASVQTETSIEKIVVMDAVKTGGAVCLDTLLEQASENRDAELESIARSVQPSHLATIIYTSGTTGTSKGAMLTHGNMAANLNCSLAEFGFCAGDVSISFLPLSHVTARHLDFAMLHLGAVLAYVPLPEQLPSALLEVRPTIFVAVPRVYEKIYAQVVAQTKGMLKSAIYHWALAVGGAYRANTLAGEIPKSPAWKLANRLVYSRIRAGMGGRVQAFISGGAPLGRELAQWYADVGIRIHEGYGLTETSPVISLNTPRAHKLGTVGKPLPNVEVRIAGDGEILVRGPSVFRGYWNRAEETANAFQEDWFRTGDIGQVDADGFLSITDRKKDLIKTSGGKFIAPQPIENSLKHNPLIAEAVILGDRRKFAAVLIAPSFPALEAWARANALAFSSRKELVSGSRVRELYEGIVEQLNLKLANFEKLKKVLLIADELSPENGALTASLKLRRRAVEERYRREIDALYAEAELSRSGAPH
jgi:long-chain acyl-CoA synthetase